MLGYIRVKGLGFLRRDSSHRRSMSVHVLAICHPVLPIAMLICLETTLEVMRPLCSAVSKKAVALNTSNAPQGIPQDPEKKSQRGMRHSL